MSENCGKQSRVFQTNSAHGKSSCNAQGQGATTCCGHCRQANHKHTRKAMTRACNEPWMRCWEDYQEDHRTNNKHASWPHCPCVSEVWGSDQQDELFPRRIGHLGRSIAHGAMQTPVEADFGQSDFGQTDFGQTKLDLSLTFTLPGCRVPRRPHQTGPPGFHTTARELQKHHQNSTRRHPEREEKNEFCGGPGEGGPGDFGRSRGGRSGKGGPGKGGPGGTEHDQTKTLKPPHGNRETKTHKHTHKHTHTQTHTQTHTHTNTQKNKSKSVLAKVGLAKVGHDRRRHHPTFGARSRAWRMFV